LPAQDYIVVSSSVCSDHRLDGKNDGWVALLLAVTFFVAAGCDDLKGTGTDQAEAPASRSPNLVIITLDTTRADALGAYGQRLETSPNFDRMAEEGVLFNEAMASSPETLPSHATIFTGKQPYSHGVRGNGGYVLADDQLTLAEVLTGAGYETRAEIAAVVVGEKTKLSQGFSTVRGTDTEGVKLRAVLRERNGQVNAEVIQVRDAGDITDSGIKFVRENQDEAFFLWLHYFSAHAPYSPVPEFNAKIPSSTYHAEVAHQDHEMGRFIAELEALGLRDNTLVVITADHGEGLLEHGERTHSYFVYDTTMKVPLLMWGLDALPKGQRIEALARTVDIAPTALELLGHYPLGDIDGVSLTPLLRGETDDLGSVAYGEASRIASTFQMSPLRFVREGRWKYIHKVNPELYDVIADPGELDNKFEAEPVVAKGLRAKLAAMLETAPVSNAVSRIDITPQAEAQLRALGYIEVAGATTLSSAGESLELFGEDPSSRTEDIDRAGWAVGAIVAKKYEDALEWARPLFERNPTSVLAGDLLSEALVQLERWPEATVVLSEILEHRPEAFVVREKLVTVLEGQGRLEEAVGELVRLNQDRPCHEPTLGMLNTSLSQQRQFEAQLSILETGARDCPNVLPVVNNYAWALATLPEAKLRDGAKAIKLIRNVIAKPGQRSPAFLDTLAAGLAEEGKFDEAMQMQTEVIKMLREAGAPEDVLRQFIQHLDTYRSSLPLRDPPV
jgi:arylsulfatase A-like enzyme